MKWINIIGLFILPHLANPVKAQLTPQFIMPIWFEDTHGNKDTVWVGGDPDASSQQMNPQFGEMEITTPFDSVFEVRAIHGYDWLLRTSKIIVEASTTFSQCYLPAHTRIMIHARYPPVRIGWDTLLMKDNYPCNINNLLTPDDMIFIIPDWTQARVIYCMMTKSEIVEDFKYPSPLPFGEYHYLKFEFEVEGEGLRFIPGLYYTGFSGPPYCYTTLSVGDQNDINEHIVVSPNPTSSALRINHPQPDQIAQLQLLDLSGRAVTAPVRFTQNVLEADLSNLPAGLYMLMIQHKNNLKVFRKIAKK